VHAHIWNFMYYYMCISSVGQKLNIELRHFRKQVNKCIIGMVLNHIRAKQNSSTPLITFT
jgi:hypothetical protein